MSAQAALWLVWKSAKGDRNKLALPLSVFGLHLFLGNWWNGVPLGRLLYSLHWPARFLASVHGVHA